MIEPNPESALNEEAGKLLLEQYEDYCKRAALMTSIHAKPQASSVGAAAPHANPSENVSTKKRPAVPKARNKEKSLKRL
jgi:ubiquitin-conjugating enzyme E2 S